MIKSFFTSYYLPERKLSNTELASQTPEYSEKQIFKLSGIHNRHLANGKETCVDLAVKAIYNLTKEYPELESTLKETNFLINCAQGQDFIAPSNGYLIHANQSELSTDCGVIDTPHGCTGFVYALGIAKGLFASKQASQILLTTADIPSYVIHSKDTYLRMLFGDAATATVLTSSFLESVGEFVYGTFSENYEALKVIHSGSKEPITKDWLNLYKDEPNQMQHGRMLMDGAEIVRFSIQYVPKLLDDVLAKNQLTLEEIDLFIFHQASGFILDVLRRKCKIPEEKFFTNISLVGNTVSNSIPIAIADAIKSGKLKKGMKVALISFGIGFSWAGTVLKL